MGCAAGDCTAAASSYDDLPLMQKLVPKPCGGLCSLDFDSLLRRVKAGMKIWG